MKTSACMKCEICRQMNVILCLLTLAVSTCSTAIDESQRNECDGNNNCDVVEPPYSPLVKCSYLPMEFLKCDPPEDLRLNETKKEELGYGCVKFGGQRYEDVERAKVFCTVLPRIECYGNRTFLKDGVPCIRYSGHYFVTTLIYSVLLGFIGLDRFCLGHTGTAVGKLLTLGGVGIWWIVDIVLLVTGSLVPEDGSNWEPYI